MQNEVKNTPTFEAQIAPQEGTQLPAQMHEAPKQESWFIIGLAFFTLVLLGTTGLLAYQNYQLKKQALQSKVIPSPVINIPYSKESTATGDKELTFEGKSSSKIYNSSNKRFAFQHPGLNVNECELPTLNDIDLGEQEVILSKGISKSNPFHCGLYTYIFFIDNSKESTIEDKITKFKESRKRLDVSIYGGYSQYLIGNVMSLSVQTNMSTIEKPYQYIAFFEDPVEGSIYSIYFAGDYHWAYSKERGEMMKSFRFLDSEYNPYPQWKPLNIEENKVWFIETQLNENNKYEFLKISIPVKHPNMARYNFNSNPPSISSKLTVQLNSEQCELYFASHIGFGHAEPIFKDKKLGSFIYTMDLYGQPEGERFGGIKVDSADGNIKTTITTRSQKEISPSCMQDIEGILSSVEIVELSLEEVEYLKAEQYRIGR